MKMPRDQIFHMWAEGNTLKAEWREVVTRCKDCDHHYVDEVYGKHWCKAHQFSYRVEPNGFCDKGEPIKTHSIDEALPKDQEEYFDFRSKMVEENYRNLLENKC